MNLDYWIKEDKAIEILNANARLIAAAPELYECLTLCTEFIEELEFNSIIAKRSRALLNRIDNGETK